jgi:2-phosphoglycerate kinase
MGADRDRNEKPKTTKNKEKRHQRYEKKRPGSVYRETRETRDQVVSVVYGRVIPEPLIHKLSIMNHHQNAHSATQNLLTCKKTEAERKRINITSEVWKGGKKEMEKHITYVKKNLIIQRYLKRKRKKDNVNI